MYFFWLFSCVVVGTCGATDCLGRLYLLGLCVEPYGKLYSLPSYNLEHESHIFTYMSVDLLKEHSSCIREFNRQREEFYVSVYVDSL